MTWRPLVLEALLVTHPSRGTSECLSRQMSDDGKGKGARMNQMPWSTRGGHALPKFLITSMAVDLPQYSLG